MGARERRGGVSDERAVFSGLDAILCDDTPSVLGGTVVASDDLTIRGGGSGCGPQWGRGRWIVAQG
jgi:hypothetical protein